MYVLRNDECIYIPGVEVFGCSALRTSQTPQSSERRGDTYNVKERHGENRLLCTPCYDTKASMNSLLGALGVVCCGDTLVFKSYPGNTQSKDKCSPTATNPAMNPGPYVQSVVEHGSGGRDKFGPNLILFKPSRRALYGSMNHSATSLEVFALNQPKRSETLRAAPLVSPNPPAKREIGQAHRRHH